MYPCAGVLNFFDVLFAVEVACAATAYSAEDVGGHGWKWVVRYPVDGMAAEWPSSKGRGKGVKRSYDNRWFTWISKVASH